MELLTKEKTFTECETCGTISIEQDLWRQLKRVRMPVSCRRNLVLTVLLAFAIDFWMLPRYIPEHFGIFPKFNDGRR